LFQQRENSQKQSGRLYLFKPYPTTCFWLLTGLKIEHMNIENTQSQMRKGILEFCIFSIIRRGEAYPSDIVEEMRGANLQIFEGTLYPLLTRLKNADMLTYRWVESNSGPPRKYFSLTPKGEAFYQELQATWNELANAVNTLASKKDSLNSTVSEINAITPQTPPPSN
jgi:PadR family transcriptional regulator, regulatory protein PadR